MDGRHHLHVRKRIASGEPYPHPDALKRFFDRLILFVALVGPLATLPQVYQVFSTRSVEGLSLITWALWMCGSVAWAVYGFVHKEPPIYLSNIIHTTLQGSVVAAILLYS